MKLRFRPLWALLIAVLPLLSACASAGTDTPRKAPTFACPQAGMMRDADRLAVFEDMANPSRETVTVKAQLYGMTYECKPRPERGALEVAVTTRFAADRMPLGGSLKGLTLPYFVAVVDASENIIVHERFDVRLTFGEGAKNLPQTRAQVQEVRVIDIPAPDAMAGGTYKILAGFELIPAQVRYNRGESDLGAPALQKQSTEQGNPPARKRHKGKN